MSQRNPRHRLSLAALALQPRVPRETKVVASSFCPEVRLGANTSFLSVKKFLKLDSPWVVSLCLQHLADVAETVWRCHDSGHSSTEFYSSEVSVKIYLS